MEFSNSTIDLTQIPAVAQVSLHPIQPTYLKVLRLEWLFASVLVAAIGGAVIFFTDSVREGYWWMAIVAVVLLFAGTYYFVQEKAFPFRAYAVREKDVMYRKGWISRTLTICPFNRIQNCSVESGPWERKFGLASLVIFTAGTEGADMRIPGLLQEDAEKLRHFILDKIHLEKDEAV